MPIGEKSVILVTGASRGLGSAIAIELAKRKHNLLLHYRNNFPEEVIKTCCSIGVEVDVIQGDFSTPATTDDFIRRLKFPLKGIVNNVGEYASHGFEEMSLWRSTFEKNLHAPYAIIQSQLENLKKNKGRVVNIGIAGLHAPRASVRAPAYFSSKLALQFLTTSLAKELAPSGITVNMVSPGYMENSIEVGSLPMSRVATLEEVAKMVAFFFDEENGYITGQNVEVAGGISL